MEKRRAVAGVHVDDKGGEACEVAHAQEQSGHLIVAASGYACISRELEVRAMQSKQQRLDRHLDGLGIHALRGRLVGVQDERVRRPERAWRYTDLVGRKPEIARFVERYPGAAESTSHDRLWTAHLELEFGVEMNPSLVWQACEGSMSKAETHLFLFETDC